MTFATTKNLLPYCQMPTQAFKKISKIKHAVNSFFRFRVGRLSERDPPGVCGRVEVRSVDAGQVEAHRAEDGAPDEGARADAAGEGQDRAEGEQPDGVHVHDTPSRRCHCRRNFHSSPQGILLKRSVEQNEQKNFWQASLAGKAQWEDVPGSSWLLLPNFTVNIYDVFPCWSKNVGKPHITPEILGYPSNIVYRMKSSLHCSPENPVRPIVVVSEACSSSFSK